MTSKTLYLLCALAAFSAQSEIFRVMSLRGNVTTYFPNGQKERGARGQLLESEQRWVIGKGGGLYLEGDHGSKVSFIDSGVLFYRRNRDLERGWQLEVSGREFYVYVAEKNDLQIEAPKLKSDSSPLEFYYESKGPRTTVNVVEGSVLLNDREESELMKTMVVENDTVSMEAFNRSEFNRLQLRHENNALGREPNRAPLKEVAPFLPWRFTLQGSMIWSHLVPQKNSTFSQDRQGWLGGAEITHDILLRRAPSPSAFPWMPRLRIGTYARMIRPNWQLSSRGKYSPLSREFGFNAGLAWDGFFLIANAGYQDFSSPFNSTKPLAWGLKVGIEHALLSKKNYQIFWGLGLNFHHTYVQIDSAELNSKGISHGKFRSASYGILTGPSLAF